MPKVSSLGCLFVIVLEVISIPRVRQGLAVRTTKLISVSEADLDDFIWSFLGWAEGTFGKVLGFQ